MVKRRELVLCETSGWIRAILRTWRLLIMAGLLAAPFYAAAQVSYAYDELGRLVLAVAPDGASVQYRYDPAGNVISVQRNSVDTLGLAEFTPNSGPVGATVTLYGSGFKTKLTDNTVKFNGKVAAVKSATANVLTVKVPSGASTGKITVSNANGSVTSATDFVVGLSMPAPTITSFTPDTGKTGDVVSLTGTNFQAGATDNKIMLGQAYSSTVVDADSPSPTLLKTPVPGGVASGKIAVTTKYGQAISTNDFYALPGTYTAADFETKVRLTVDGPMLPISIVAPGKKALVIFDVPPAQYLSFVARGGTFVGAVTVEVYRPDGTKVESFAASGDDVDDFANVIPTAGGTYTMVLRPTGTETGTVNIGVVSSVRGTLDVDAAQPTPVTLGLGQNARYTFNGTAGQSLQLLWTNNTLGDGNSGTNNCTYLYVYNPDGTRLIATDVTQCESDRPGKVVSLAKLPASGTYRVAVLPNNLDAGQFKLHLRTANSGEAIATNGTAKVVNVANQEL
ncbi:IPT/TIG domain-containing protein, partial [Ideonella sp. DXS29W]